MATYVDFRFNRDGELTWITPSCDCCSKEVQIEDGKAIVAKATANNQLSYAVQAVR